MHPFNGTGHVFNELLLTCHISNVKQNEFARLPSLITMSLSQPVVLIVSRMKAICCTLHQDVYQLKAEMTDVFFPVKRLPVLRLISGFPQRSRKSVKVKKINFDSSWVLK